MCLSYFFTYLLIRMINFSVGKKYFSPSFSPQVMYCPIFNFWNPISAKFVEPFLPQSKRINVYVSLQTSLMFLKSSFSVSMKSRRFIPCHSFPFSWHMVIYLAAISSASTLPRQLGKMYLGISRSFGVKSTLKGVVTLIVLIFSVDFVFMQYCD